MAEGIRLRLQVRLAETDALGVVYHGAYLIYFELGRIEVLRRAGFAGWIRPPGAPAPPATEGRDPGASAVPPGAGAGAVPPAGDAQAALPGRARAAPPAGQAAPPGSFRVARVECQYRAPAFFGDVLELTAWVARVGRSSFGLRYLLDRPADGTRVAEGEDVVVCLDAWGRPRELPPALRAYLLSLHRPAGTPRSARLLAGIARIALGSAQPAKVGAARAVLDRLVPHAFLECVPVEGLEEQPWGEEGARSGAERRARAALASGADLGIGMEDAAVRGPEGVWVSGWCVVLGRDGRRGEARTASFLLPPALARAVEKGEPLGSALARAASRAPRGRAEALAVPESLAPPGQGSQDGPGAFRAGPQPAGAGPHPAGQGGAVGWLTGGLLTRRQRWEQALVLALLPWLRPDLYPRPRASASLGPEEAEGRGPEGAAGVRAGAEPPGREWGGRKPVRGR